MVSNRYQNYLERIEILKTLLVSCATGGSRDSVEYSEIRLEALGATEIVGKLPRFIKTCRNLDEFWDFIQPKFKHYRERREFIKDEFEPLLSLLENQANSPSDSTLTSQLQNVDSVHVQQAWQKALERREADPDGAITMARTLLESVCIHILDESNSSYNEGSDLPKLFSQVTQILEIAPNQQIEDILKRIGGGCCSIVEGLGALRNKLGDSHGRSKGTIKCDSRHAQLSVNLAGSMAVYLIETWESSREEF